MHYNMNFLECKQNIQSVGKNGGDVDNVDNVETKLHIMFMGNPKNAEN